MYRTYGAKGGNNTATFPFFFFTLLGKTPSSLSLPTCMFIENYTDFPLMTQGNHKKIIEKCEMSECKTKQYFTGK